VRTISFRTIKKKKKQRFISKNRGLERKGATKNDNQTRPQPKCLINPQKLSAHLTVDSISSQTFQISTFSSKDEQKVNENII
jgi:hypothetical protein